MSRTSTSATTKKSWLLWGGGALLLAVALVVAVLQLPLWHEPTPPPDTSQPPQEPLKVDELASLTVPGTARTSPHSFKAHPGTTYLLSFDISTVKPEGTPGTAMYLAVNLACGTADGGTSRSVGGTQNLITGEAVTLSNQFLLTVDSEEEQVCRVALSSPNESAAAVGATVDIDVSWSMEPLQGDAEEFDPELRLPLVVDPGERAIAFKEEVPLAGVSAVELKGTLQLTSCTIVNGSREGGEPMCKAEHTDDRGSSFDVEVQARILGPDGRPCGAENLMDATAHVDRHTHHQLLHLETEADAIEDPCGTEVEVVVTVDNTGPAPLVIHGNGSSLVVLMDRQ